MNANELRKFFGGDQNILFFCGDDYMAKCICQDSMNCMLKTDALM